MKIDGKGPITVKLVKYFNKIITNYEGTMPKIMYQVRSEWPVFGHGGGGNSSSMKIIGTFCYNKDCRWS